jgi:pimeloyl-ACP methyl ester carboxylesterase
MLNLIATNKQRTRFKKAHKGLFCICVLAVACSNPKSTSIENLKAAFPENVHQFVDLGAGSTHFQRTQKDASSATIVFIHGVSGPMSSWDKTWKFFSKRKPMLRYDLYGRGFSERVNVKNSLDLFTSQLRELLQRLEIKKVHLVGSSFGCVVASSFANNHQKEFEIESLTLIGPAGFPIQTPLLARLRDVPVLGNILFSMVGRKTILAQNKKYFVNEAVWQEHKPFYEVQLSVPGTTDAMLSTMRNSPVQNYLAGYKKIGTNNHPVLTIWGTNDVTFPYKNHSLLQSLIPRMQMHSIQESAHLPQFEKPKQVNQILEDFLKKAEGE